MGIKTDNGGEVAKQNRQLRQPDHIVSRMFDVGAEKKGEGLKLPPSPQVRLTQIDLHSQVW